MIPRDPGAKADNSGRAAFTTLRRTMFETGAAGGGGVVVIGVVGAGVVAGVTVAVMGIV